jgi:hypothetical protein
MHAVPIAACEFFIHEKESNIPPAAEAADEVFYH